MSISGPETFVSVVIPTRNRRDLLALTLRSVSRQKGVALEVIVVDDASEPATTPEQLGYEGVRVIRHDRPLGPNGARNRGIAEANGEWIAFCDDDDLWAPVKLERQLAMAAATRRTWAYGGAVYVDERLRVHGGSPPLEPARAVESLLHYNSLPAAASNVVVRADTLAQVGGFDAALPHMADWDLWIRLSRIGLPACEESPVVAYRLHATNFSFSSRDAAAELATLRARYGPAIHRSRTYRHLARLSLRTGKRAEAARLLLKASVLERDEYGFSDLTADTRLLAEHARGSIRRWFKLRPSRGDERRHLRELASDPHREWKAKAQAWLDELSSG